MKKQAKPEIITKQTTPSEHPLKICIATEKWEKERIYRFRYQLYVEQISKTLTFVDHRNKQMSDEMDKHSILLYAESGSEIVGTMRLTIGDPSQFPKPLPKIFSMHKFKTILHDYSTQLLGLSTKLAISPKYWGSILMYQLLATAFKTYQENNIPFSLGACNPHLISLYERLGHRRFARNFTDPGYGLLVPILLIIEDSAYLKSIHSPMYRIARKKPHNAELVQRFKQAFPEAAKHINTQLTSAADLWNYIQAKFAGTSITSLPVFRNLTDTDCLTLLQFGAIFPCTNGDCIISSGDMVNELYFLLSGAVVSESPAGSALLRPGQCFGGGLTSSLVHSATITAVTESEIIVIPRQAFEKFTQLHPAPAAAFLNNIATLAGPTVKEKTEDSLSQA